MDRFALYAIILHDLLFMVLSVLTAKYLFDRYRFNGSNRVIRLWALIFLVVSGYSAYLVYTANHMTARGEILVLSFGLFYSALVLRIGTRIWKWVDFVAVALFACIVYLLGRNIPETYIGFIAIAVGLIAITLVYHKPIMVVITPLGIDFYIVLMSSAQFAAAVAHIDVVGDSYYPLMLGSSILVSVAAGWGFWSAMKEVLEITLRRDGAGTYAEQKIEMSVVIPSEESHQLMDQLDAVIERMKGEAGGPDKTT